MIGDGSGALFAVLGVPALPGARCRGRHHLFDPPGSTEDADTVAQRHAQALRLCGGCPARDPCAAWFTALPRRQRPLGVIAGQISQAPTPRKKAPQ